MHFSLLFNHKDYTKILAQLSLWETPEVDEEEKESEDKKSVTSNKSIQTGFRSTIQDA